MFSKKRMTRWRLSVDTPSRAAKNLLQISPMVSPLRPTTVSEWKSFCDGIVTIRPPAMSSASRTISYGKRVTFCLQTLAKSKSI